MAHGTEKMATPYEDDISGDFPFKVHRADILGLQMAYIDTRPNEGAQATALFLHGNGSSSYIWRNIIPHVSSQMRCVAPDLIGMGDSDKVQNMPYRFTDHYTFLSTFINTVIPTGPVLLITHDWGSALGLHWAWQQTETSAPQPSPRLRGVVLMEFVRPFPTWKDFGQPPKIEQAFRAFRTPDVGRKMIVEDNLFRRATLPSGQLRRLTDVETARYEAPFLEPANREVLYMWTNQVPIEHRPSDVYDIVVRYHDWLLQAELPKLLFWATPGAIVTPERAQWYAESLKNVETIDLGSGLHNLQEDHPHAIGKAIAGWAKRVLYVSGK